MNSFKNLFFIIFLLSVTISFAADHDQQKLKDQVNEIVQEIQSGDQMASKDENQEEEVPLNDPFAGNEGNTRNAMMAGVDEEEAQDENSLYNFKLVGLISGKDHSYISLANSSGEVITLTLGQHLGKIKLVDLRLTEAIFQKDDEKFMIIDFNGGIRESDEY